MFCFWEAVEDKKQVDGLPIATRYGQPRSVAQKSSLRKYGGRRQESWHALHRAFPGSTFFDLKWRVQLCGTTPGRFSGPELFVFIRPAPLAYPPVLSRKKVAVYFLKLF